VVLEDANRDYVEEARGAILETLAALNPESRTDPEEVEEEIRKALRRYFNRRFGRRPVVLPFVVEM
jgi:mRNA degradation ribonuclease J1/J2